MIFSGGALGVLTSTLCGCFSGGTTGSRVRATRSTSAAVAAAAASEANNSTRGSTRLHRRGRGNNGTERSNSLGSTWHNVQDKQPTSAPTAS